VRFAVAGDGADKPKTKPSGHRKRWPAWATARFLSRRTSGHRAVEQPGSPWPPTRSTSA